MAEIYVDTETEGHNNWTFDVRVEDQGREFAHVVTLSWQDYDLWSRGRVSPERVVRAIFNFLLERESAAAVLAKFDCATVRRYFPDVDDELPGLI